MTPNSTGVPPGTVDAELHLLSQLLKVGVAGNGVVIGAGDPNDRTSQIVIRKSGALVAGLVGDQLHGVKASNVVFRHDLSLSVALGGLFGIHLFQLSVPHKNGRDEQGNDAEVAQVLEAGPHNLAQPERGECADIDQHDDGDNQLGELAALQLKELPVTTGERVGEGDGIGAAGTEYHGYIAGHQGWARLHG